jgi:CheY-like chemotaxis protein
LIVDDDKDIRKIVNLTLTHLGGFHVVAAESGEEALALVQNRRFEVVILDMCMPHMDGEMTLRALHPLPNMQEVPVVLLSAHPSFRLPKGLEQWGVKRILEKPFNPVEFNRHIKEILEKERDGANNKASK